MLAIRLSKADWAKACTPSIEVAPVRLVAGDPIYEVMPAHLVVLTARGFAYEVVPSRPRRQEKRRHGTADSKHRRVPASRLQRRPAYPGVQVHCIQQELLGRFGGVTSVQRQFPCKASGKPALAIFMTGSWCSASWISARITSWNACATWKGFKGRLEKFNQLEILITVADLLAISESAPNALHETLVHSYSFPNSCSRTPSAKLPFPPPTILRVSAACPGTRPRCGTVS